MMKCENICKINKIIHSCLWQSSQRFYTRDGTENNAQKLDSSTHFKYIKSRLKESKGQFLNRMFKLFVLIVEEKTSYWNIRIYQDQLGYLFMYICVYMCVLCCDTSRCVGYR